MKTVLDGQIEEMRRERDVVEITLRLKGNVKDAQGGPESKTASAEVKLRVKPLVADRLRFGQKLFVVITDEEDEL
jgi:hypothetical protein